MKKKYCTNYLYHYIIYGIMALIIFLLSLIIKISSILIAFFMITSWIYVIILNISEDRKTNAYMNLYHKDYWNKIELNGFAANINYKRKNMRIDLNDPFVIELINSYKKWNTFAVFVLLCNGVGFLIAYMIN